jgi:hypothetical protein
MADSIKTVGTRQHGVTDFTLLVATLAGQFGEPNQQEPQET